MRAAAWTLGLCAWVSAHAAEVDLAPFSARYEAYWRNIPVGVSEITLTNDAQTGHFVYVWTTEAKGVFRLAYSSALTQTSWFSIEDGHALPHRYEGVEGASRLALDFDWHRKRAIGMAEQKPVNLALKDGAQDFNSIQIELMLDLKNHSVPKTFEIIDKDELKTFIYTVEGMQTLTTSIGALSTVVIASARAGNNRILRMWFAPSLGYIPVQAERVRDGKLEFAMRIRSLKR